VGAAVRARRLADDVTQVELAERANVALASLKSLEAGEGATVRTLVRVVHALGADDWFDALAPVAVFNPLDVLEAARRPSSRRPRQRASKRRT
jgi:transcriptional regulator with XRE-family HTH domain